MDSKLRSAAAGGATLRKRGRAIGTAIRKVSESERRDPFHSHQEPGPWPRRVVCTCAQRLSRRGREVRDTELDDGAPGERLEPAANDHCQPSLAALALLVTSCYKQLALPPQQGRQWPPLFLLLTITAGWTLGGGGCATRSTQWALCAGPVAALCSMAVDGGLR